MTTGTFWHRIFAHKSDNFITSETAINATLTWYEIGFGGKQSRIEPLSAIVRTPLGADTNLFTPVISATNFIYSNVVLPSLIQKL